MSVRQLTPPKYQPSFSHRPGIKVFFAGSSHVIQVFPTAFRVYACRNDDIELVKEVTFPQLGPLSGWTVFVDSMRHSIVAQGTGASGFVRYRIEGTSDGIVFRPSSSMMRVSINGDETEVLKGERFLLVDVPCTLPPFPSPRLLLGCNKAPNWDRISTSPSMDEVLPLWYQMAKPSPENSIEPSSTCFGAIVEAIKNGDTKAVLSAFSTFFKVAMDGFFTPKRKDDLFLGYPGFLFPEDLPISHLHSHLCQLIRSLFLKEEGSVVSLLPCLPDELISGRLLRETLLSGHTIDLEWRKGKLRRVLLHAQSDGYITIKAHSTKASIRMLHSSMRKRMYTVGEEIEIVKGEHYLLDNFST